MAKKAKPQAADVDDILDGKTEDVLEGKKPAAKAKGKPAAKAAKGKEAKAAKPAAKKGKEAKAAAAAEKPAKKAKKEASGESRSAATEAVRTLLSKTRKLTTFADLAEQSGYNLRLIRRTARAMRADGTVEAVREGTVVFVRATK